MTVHGHPSASPSLNGGCPPASPPRASRFVRRWRRDCRRTSESGHQTPTGSMIRRQCLSAPVLPRRERGGDAVRVGRARGPGPGASGPSRRRVVASAPRRVVAGCGWARTGTMSRWNAPGGWIVAFSRSDRDSVPSCPPRPVRWDVVPTRSGKGGPNCADRPRIPRSRLKSGPGDIRTLSATQNPFSIHDAGRGGFRCADRAPEHRASTRAVPPDRGHPPGTPNPLSFNAKSARRTASSKAPPRARRGLVS